MRSPDILHALVLLNLLFVCGAWCLARPSFRSSAILAVVAVAWLLWNSPFEGQVLIVFTHQHGMTESDLLSIAALVIAAAGAYRTWRARNRRIHLHRSYRIDR